MKKILSSIIAVVASLFVVTASTAPVMATAENFAVDTVILDQCGDEADGANGEGVKCILKLVVNILSVGIGILGVIGITIVGIQYLTAGGNEEQTRKAKRRLFEIILGLVVYVAIYALLQWLMPNFGTS